MNNNLKNNAITKDLLDELKSSYKFIDEETKSKAQKYKQEIKNMWKNGPKKPKNKKKKISMKL
jgi:hypothetical protein